MIATEKKEGTAASELVDRDSHRGALRLECMRE